MASYRCIDVDLGLINNVHPKLPQLDNEHLYASISLEAGIFAPLIHPLERCCCMAEVDQLEKNTQAAERAILHGAACTQTCSYRDVRRGSSAKETALVSVVTMMIKKHSLMTWRNPCHI